MEQVNLSIEQQNLFDYIEQSENNIFVTGRAGTGKSTLLSYLTRPFTWWAWYGLGSL
jgi:GTP-binding protein EngB required for normal cell division